jgi:hypothetical protein
MPVSHWLLDVLLVTSETLLHAHARSVSDPVQLVLLPLTVLNVILVLLDISSLLINSVFLTVQKVFIMIQALVDV